MAAECSEGECTVGSIELCRLLGEDPWGAGEEAGAHVVFPDTNKEDPIWGPGGIGEEPWCMGSGVRWMGVRAPCWGGHGKGFQEGTDKVVAWAVTVPGAMMEGCIWAGQEREDAPGGLGKPNQFPEEATQATGGEGA